ncbi:hypothetical protein ACET3Z_021990 [Daucus carota]
MMILQRPLQTRNPRLQLPQIIFIFINPTFINILVTIITIIIIPTIFLPNPTPKVQLMPRLHQHLLDTRHMQIILLACRPVAPAPPLPPALMTRRAHLPVQIKLHFSVVQRHREFGAAGVEVEAAGAAVVDEPRHVLLAGVAVARREAGGARQELEGALGVEGVGDGGGGDGAVHVEVVVAAAAFVFGADADFVAAVAFEGGFGVLEFELVLGVAQVGDDLLAVLHGLVAT